MKRKAMIAAICILGLLAVALLCVPATRAMRERGRRFQCCSRVHNTFLVFKMFAMDNNHAFPTNIQQMSGYIDIPGWFVCPGRSNMPMNLSYATCTDWLDYICVPWPDGEELTWAEYPVIYDRRLSNHGGRGINIGFVDGSARWDSKAEWLQKFAKEHPDLRIPLPEDLR